MRRVLAFVVFSVGCSSMCGNPPDLPRGTKFLKCGDPARMGAKTTREFGLICGANAVARYGLVSGLATFCNVGSPMLARYDAYSLTCTIVLPIQVVHAGGLFCQTSSPVVSKIALHVRDVTRREGGGDSVGVDDSVYVYTWEIVGSDPCRQHPNGHDVALGLERAIDIGGTGATRARALLELLHGETWDYIANVPVANPVQCVAHPDDN